MAEDYYKTLGIDKNAPGDVIKRPTESLPSNIIPIKIPAANRPRRNSSR